MTTTNNEQKVYNAQIENIYQTIPTHLATSVSVSILVAWLLWSEENSTALIIWLFVGSLSIGLRLASLHAFNKIKDNYQGSLKNWAWLAVFQLSFYGLMWGLVPVLFVDIGTDPTEKVIVAYFFSSFILIGQAVTYCAYRPMWFSYAIPASGAMLLMLIVDNTPGSNIWALYLVLLIIFCISSLQKNHRSIMEEIKLKLEYAELVPMLRQEKEKADRANLSKSTFLASASHDLRQPVHAMNLFIEMLQKKPIPDDAKMLVDRIASSAINLKSLFSSLLDISSLDAGSVDVNKKVINVAGCVEAVSALHALEIAERKLALHNDVQDLNVFTDPVLLGRILSNLLVNAIRYTDQGSITITVKTVDQFAVISIDDTGKGISAENLKHIFDEFIQLHNPERDRNKGLGLGLAICRRLANLLGTDIVVRSKLGEGSSFSLALPLDDRKEQGGASKASASDDIDLSQYAVMIVDDEKDIRDAMPMLLESWGCQKVAAVNGDEEANRAISSDFIPDLVISDFRLRNNCTGLQVIEGISELLGYRVRAILITGDTGPESLLKIRESGISVLHKPVAAADLRSAIRDVLL